MDLRIGIDPEYNADPLGSLIEFELWLDMQ